VSIIILALIGGLLGGAPTIVLIGFFILLILFLFPLIHDYLITRKTKRSSTILSRLIEDLGDKELKFNKPLKARPIIYKTMGWKSASYRYYFNAYVTSKGEYRIDKVHGFEDLSYGVVIRKGSEGAILLPGLEFDEPELHDMVLLYIPFKQPFTEPATLDLTEPGGSSILVRLYGGKGVRGEAMLSGGGRASLYLVARFLKGHTELKLADLEGRKAVSFSAKLSLDQPVLVVAHKKSSPRAIASRLGRDVMAGDRPQYSLVAEFKKGLRKFKAETKLYVTKIAS
jgi:hypothetical protein